MEFHRKKNDTCSRSKKAKPELERLQVNLPKKFNKKQRRKYKQQNRQAHKEVLERTGQEGKYGEVWVWSAVDPVSKYIFPDVIGSRRRKYGKLLVETLKDRRKNDQDDLLLQTDNYGGYESIIKECFADSILSWKAGSNGEKIPDEVNMPENILYTVLTKKRNQQGEVEAVDGKVVFGTEDRILKVLRTHDPTHGINTSFIERQNLNRRLFNGRLRRKTIAYSKNYDCFVAQLDLQRVYANFCWSHHTLRKQYGRHTSPAMAIEATNHIWSFDEIFWYRLDYSHMSMT